MKKWLCLALALLTLTVCVWAAAESTDWNYDLNYAILRGYNGAGGDVAVPAEIDGFTVDVIGVSVFSSEAITSLTLPETVLELRSNAVSGCENMTSVTLPQSLVVINRMNFFSCNALERDHHSRGRALHRRQLVQILRRAAEDHLRGRLPADRQGMFQPHRGGRGGLCSG